MIIFTSEIAEFFGDHALCIVECIFGYLHYCNSVFIKRLHVIKYSSIQKKNPPLPPSRARVPSHFRAFSPLFSTYSVPARLRITRSPVPGPRSPLPYSLLWGGSGGTEKCKKTQKSGVLSICGYTIYTSLYKPVPIGKALFDPKKKFFFSRKRSFRHLWVVVGSKFVKNFHFFFLTQKFFFRQGNGKND